MACSLVFFFAILASSIHLALGERLNIVDFGAIADDASNEAAYANSAAILRTLLAANESAATVLVPAGSEFHVFTTEVSGLHSVTLEVAGTLVASKNITEWLTAIVDFTAVLWFNECRGLTLTGQGTLDGQGYDWWWANILRGIARPHLLYVSASQDVEVSGLHFKNSPKFHCRVYDALRLHIHNIDIWVDSHAQRALLKEHNLWHELEPDSSGNPPGGGLGGIPIFPINTDGIDISGRDLLVENSTIQNFDDAVVVKPCNENSYWGPCAQDILVRNMQVTYGVGMSIGSVTPGLDVSCIKNVTFENVRFQYPLKAVYIKTNPGDEGSALIDGITFRDFTVEGALWYPIWIGPQQQTTGPGESPCSFFYPLAGASCPTNPLVTISNILLENVVCTGGVLLPGVLLGNASNPIYNMTFRNVQNSGRFLVSPDYSCEGVVGQVLDSYPDPGCFSPL